MTEAEIVQLLGGGKVGQKRYDMLRRRCRSQRAIGQCQICERLFINFKFFWVPKGELRPAGFDGREGQPPARTHSLEPISDDASF